MEITMLMTDGQDMAQVFCRPSLRHRKLAEIGFAVYNHLRGSFVPLLMTVLPDNDNDGCNREFNNTYAKAIEAGYRFVPGLS